MGSMGNRVSRNRRFVIGTGVAAAAITTFYVAALGRGALIGCAQDRVSAAPDPAVQGLIRIGNCYLQQLEETGQSGGLDRDIAGLEVTPDTGAVQRHLGALRRQAAREFARGQTVMCDGWVLAKSEADFCAALVLRSRQHKA